MESQALEQCILCPRECKVNRAAGKKGYCKTSGELLVARAALHFWEEPCISGTKGSGAVFFSGCPLGCVFCQNQNISGGKAGKSITTDRLAAIFLALQEQGAHNINLVTPTHYTLHIIEALEKAKEKGLKLPIVYNCGGYEKVETLKQLRGLIDIYLPDLKYKSRLMAQKYAHAENYFEVAAAAIEEMFQQVGEPLLDETGLLKRGVMVRHLALPGFTKDSKEIIAYLHENYGDKIYMSVMNQYTPLKGVEAYPELNRRLSEKQYDKLTDYMIGLGIEKAFIQEGGTAEESFIPEFDGEGV